MPILLTRSWILLSTCIIILALLPYSVPRIFRPTALSPVINQVQRQYHNMTGISSAHKKADVYFISHGGPPSMFDKDSAPYGAWRRLQKIILDAQPKGLVVVSAHWESDSSGAVEVNVDNSNPLIYDFYGFPKHYYDQTFTSHGTPQLAAGVVEALESAGLKVEKMKRGLDHGVWVPFKVAFEGSTDLPLVQVSLPSTSNPVESVRLGKALASLRDQGYAVVGSGQTVHNLRDFFSGRPTPYSTPFLHAARDAVHSSKPAEAVATLFRHPLYKSAHPSPEHLLPLAVAAGAVKSGDKVEDILMEVDKGGMGWGMWRWTASE